MKTKILISIFNSFFYLLYSIPIFIYLYEPSFQFFLIFTLHFVVTLFSIIKWIIGFNQNIFINSYFTNYDILGKIIPLLLLLAVFIFPDNKDKIIGLSFVIVWFFICITLGVGLFFSSTILIIKAAKGQDLFQLYGVEWEHVFKMLNSCTSGNYFIFDTPYVKEYRFEIFSNHKNITLNCNDLFFIIDNIYIYYSLINSMQIEYNKKLFDMDDKEIDILKMISI